VALQVQDVQPFNAPQARHVEANDIRQVVPVGVELFDSVAPHMVDNGAIPMSQVYLDVIIHNPFSHTELSH
jgi:hypothetical protein